MRPATLAPVKGTVEDAVTGPPAQRQPGESRRRPGLWFFFTCPARRNDMSRQHPPDDTDRYVKALAPFKATLAAWEELLDEHPDPCPCQLCDDLIHMHWLCENLYNLAESCAPGEALGRLRGWDTPVAGAMEEALADARRQDAEAAASAAQEAKAPRGGFF
jgi:hypothetical protein